jgi:hypothetical protein
MRHGRKIFNFGLEPDQKEVEKINAFVSDLKLYDYEHSEGNRLGVVLQHSFLI